MRFISNRKTNAFAALFIAGSILFSSVTAYADNVNDLENKSTNIESELSSIDSELLEISNKISDTEAQIAITDSEMQRTEDMLEQSVQDEEHHYDAMKTRIKFMYESGNSSLIELLFSAKDISDFVNKADFVQSVSEYDREMLTELKDIKQDIISQHESISNQKHSLDSLKSELTTTEASLSSRAAELSIDLDTYKARIEELKAEEERKQRLQEMIENNNHASNSNADNETSSKPAENNPGSGNDSSDNSDSNKPVTPSPDANVSDLELFAALLQCEAHSDYDSLLAVATVIMNRVESPRFPNNVRDVIYAPGQFEPTWTGRLDKVLKQGANSLSKQVASDALNGKRLASVSDCYYFLYAPSTSRECVVVGDNVFFQSW